MAVHNVKDRGIQKILREHLYELLPGSVDEQSMLPSLEIFIGGA